MWSHAPQHICLDSSSRYANLDPMEPPDTALHPTLREEIRHAVLQADPGLSRFNPLPRILFFDDFDRGLCGWSELIGNYRGSLDAVGTPHTDLEWDMRPPMLSSLNMWDVGTVGSLNGTYALKVATRPQRGHIAHPVKRITLGGRGFIQLEAYFTFKSEASTLDMSAGTEDEFGRDDEIESDEAVHSFGFGFDAQDDEERHWPAIRYLHSDDSGLVEKWQWHAGGVRHPHLDGWLDVPNGHQPLCYNEIPTKHNWHYIRWLVDLDRREYVELQSNSRVFDLRGKRHVYRNIHADEMQFVPYMTGEHPTKPRLWNMLNLDFFIETRSNRRCFLYLDSVVLSSTWPKVPVDEI